MKNNSTPVTAKIISDKQNFNVQDVENFDKKEFTDVLTELDKLKLSPRKSTLDKVLEFARKN